MRRSGIINKVVNTNEASDLQEVNIPLATPKVETAHNKLAEIEASMSKEELISLNTLFEIFIESEGLGKIHE
jgi:hypothetical protein